MAWVGVNTRRSLGQQSTSYRIVSVRQICDPEATDTQTGMAEERISIVTHEIEVDLCFREFSVTAILIGNILISLVLRKRHQFAILVTEIMIFGRKRVQLYNLGMAGSGTGAEWK